MTPIDVAFALSEWIEMRDFLDVRENHLREEHERIKISLKAISDERAYLDHMIKSGTKMIGDHDYGV